MARSYGSVALVTLAIFGLIVCAQALNDSNDNNELHEQRSLAWKQFVKLINDRVASRNASNSDLFSVITSRYPNCVSFGDVLQNIPLGQGGQAFLTHFAEALKKVTGVSIPDWVLGLLFEESSLLLNFLQFSPLEMYTALEVLNIAYQAGEITYTAPPVDVLPSGFNLANMATFPLNISWYYPGPPVELAPQLWQGFIPGNFSMETIRSEIVMSLAFNQLANNSHLPASAKRFSVVYNGQSYSAIDDLLAALMANGHSIKAYITWRAVDFFGYRTKVNGQWREVPVPVMLNTGIYDNNGNEAVIPAIHDEIVIDIASGPSTKGTAFNGKLLWYEGNTGIGFIAGDLYGYGTWVGSKDEEPLTGLEAIRYTHLAGVFSDVLIQSAIVNNLYGGGYGTTGICVDSVAIIEHTAFSRVSLYPLIMEKYLVEPLVQKYYALDNRDSSYFAQLLRSVDIMVPDIYTIDSDTIRRAALSISQWKEGEEPFQCVIDAKRIFATPRVAN